MDSNDVVSLRHYVEVLIEQYKEAHKREHELIAENVSQTKENLDIRLKSMNEFREQILDERGKLVNVDKFDLNLQALNKLMETHFESNQIRISTLEKIIANLSGRWTATTAVIGILLLVLQIVLKFVIK